MARIFFKTVWICVPYKSRWWDKY